MNRLQEFIEELKLQIDGYEIRTQQLEMMQSVYDAMQSNKKAAAHAPTGTGKSLGYLIPGAAFKFDNPTFRFTINTYTKALQGQLEKDIELVNKVYMSMCRKHNRPAYPLKTVTLKGNSNYFCEHRFREAKDDNLPINLVSELERVVPNAPVKDRESLGVDMADRNWERVKVDGCLKRQCAFKDRCTYFQHYSQIDTYDIVISNHALFFFRFFYSDKFWDGFNFHIFDEAHKLERGILDASTYELSFRNIDGYIYQGVKFAERLNAPENEIEAWRQNFTVKNPTYMKAKEFFEELGNWFKPPNTAANLDVMGENFQPMKAKILIKALYDWQKAMYEGMINQVLSFIDDKEENEVFQKGRTSWVLNLLGLKEFGSLSNHKDGIGVLWGELKGKRGLLKVTPESIDLIPSPFQTGFLFTSGTIAQNGTNKPIAKRLNVSLDIDLVLTTPFPLAKNTMAYLDDTINPKMQGWKYTLQEAIYQHLLAGKQKTFVLFTSNTLMKEAYEALLPRMYDIESDKPLETWIQEDGNYKDVMESFRNLDVRSILFGSLTYFEGVDLKGDALTHVILTRLPYSPPHPIQEILEKKSGYGQWEALVRFEQAYGRIMRTSNDYGVFSVLDSRTSYLKNFRHLFETENIPVTNRIEDVFQFYKNKITP